MNQKETAAYYGIDVKTLRKLVQDGELPAPRGRGAYDLPACSSALMSAYLELKRAKAAEPEAPAEPDAKSRLDDLKLQRAEMDLAKERRTFLPVALFEHYVEQVGSQWHAFAEAFPSQIKQRIPHLRSAEINIIRQLLAKMLNDIADFDVSDPSGL